MSSAGQGRSSQPQRYVTEIYEGSREPPELHVRKTGRDRARDGGGRTAAAPPPRSAPREEPIMTTATTLGANPRRARPADRQDRRADRRPILQPPIVQRAAELEEAAHVGYLQRPGADAELQREAEREWEARLMSSARLAHGDTTTAQAEADPDPRGYDALHCNVPVQDVKKPEEAAWAATSTTTACPGRYHCSDLTPSPSRRGRRMSTQGPGWLTAARDDEPVELAQALGEWAATHRAGPGRTYVTEVSVPKLGDGGTQRLHSQMLREPDREREAGT